MAQYTRPIQSNYSYFSTVHVFVLVFKVRKLIGRKNCAQLRTSFKNAFLLFLLPAKLPLQEKRISERASFKFSHALASLQVQAENKCKEQARVAPGKSRVENGPIGDMAPFAKNGDSLRDHWQFIFGVPFVARPRNPIPKMMTVITARRIRNNSNLCSADCANFANLPSRGSLLRA